MTLPTVSIAMCVKNVEHTVKAAVESILNQDYPLELIELIIIDGCSSDNTISIIKKSLSNHNIKFDIFYEDKGLGYARQIALENSNGKYIIWVDGDIVLSHNYVRELVRFMENNPRVGIAAGKFAFSYNNGMISELEEIDWVIGDYEKRENSINDPTKVCCAGSIYRAKAIKQIGGFNDEIKGACEDIDLAFRMRMSGWQIYFGVNAELWHIKRHGLRSLWSENYWYGYGGHYISHKYRHKEHIWLFGRIFRRCSLAYKITRRKTAFLLLILYFFKKIAWCCGFIKAHIDSYGHTFN